jgi:hypothetical protein
MAGQGFPMKDKVTPGMALMKQQTRALSPEYKHSVEIILNMVFNTPISRGETP